MPVTTRSQAAAAAQRRRDLEARRGVLTRRLAALTRENVAPPAETALSPVSSRKRKNSRTAAVEVKKAARCVRRRGNSKAVARGSHISSLCDDLLLEILLHLPSAATIVRAACACTTWRRAVASSPHFRRRFRALHPLPLLGLFPHDHDTVSIVGAFVPALPHGSRDDDHDLAAAVRSGDFSLPSLPAGGWRVTSNACRLGNILLYNREDKSLAKLNPFTRQIEIVPRDLVSRNMLGVRYFASAVLSSSRLMLLDNAGSKMKASIFSMDTGVICSATPWVDVPVACPDQVDGRVPYGMLAVQLNGSVVYYLCENWGYVASIDTATMELAVVELPQCVSRQGLAVVGETDDGATCLVYSDGRDVGVLMHTRDVDGVQKWMLDKVVSMDAELQRVLPAGQFGDRVCVLRVLAVRDGYAYLSTPVTLQDHYWLLSLCLATMKLEKLFQGTYGGCTWIPYIMPWPRSLIGW